MGDGQDSGRPTVPAPPTPDEPRPEGAPPDDPFAVRPGARPHPGDGRPPGPRHRSGQPGPPRDPGRQPEPPPPLRPADVEAARPLLRRVRNAGLLSSVACLLAVVVPPLGAVLGLLGAVRSIRLRPAVVAAGLRPALVVLPVVTGAAAFVVGVLATVVAVVLGPQLLDLNGCLRAANTHTAEANCRDAFQVALDSRLG